MANHNRPLTSADTQALLCHLNTLGEGDRDYRAFVNVGLGNSSIAALVDGGNLWRTAISARLFRQLGFSDADLQPIAQKECGTAKKGQGLTVLGELRRSLHVTLGRHATKFRLRPVVIEDLSHDMNLAGPWLGRNGMTHDYQGNKLRVNGQDIPLHHGKGIAAVPKATVSVSSVYVTDKVTIDPQSEAFIPAHASEVAGNRMEHGYGVVEGSFDFMRKTDLHNWQNGYGYCDPAGHMVVGVMNTLNTPVTIQAGTRYGTITLACDDRDKDRFVNRISIMSAGTDKERPQEAKGSDGWSLEEKVAWLRKELHLDDNPVLDTPEKLGQVIALLVKRFDAFTTDDSPGRTDWIEHRIDVQGTRPIKTKCRPVNPVLETDLRQQIQKWLDNDIIQASTSPWSFGLVAARKKDGRIRWCVDYRDGIHRRRNRFRV